MLPGVKWGFVALRYEKTNALMNKFSYLNHKKSKRVPDHKMLGIERGLWGFSSPTPLPEHNDTI